MTAHSILIQETEAQFQSRLTQVAEDLGWEWLHVATTGIGRHSPMRGTLGKGWPDLTLIKGDRLIFAELKADSGGHPTVTQKLILGRLALTGAEVYVWRPSHWNHILYVLSRRGNAW